MYFPRCCAQLRRRIFMGVGRSSGFMITGSRKTFCRMLHHLQIRNTSSLHGAPKVDHLITTPQPNHLGGGSRMRRSLLHETARRVILELKHPIGSGHDPRRRFVTESKPRKPQTCQDGIPGVILQILQILLARITLSSVAHRLKTLLLQVPRIFMITYQLKMQALWKKALHPAFARLLWNLHRTVLMR